MNIRSLQIPVLDRAPDDRRSDRRSWRGAPISFDLALVDQVYRRSSRDRAGAVGLLV
jgi:hypothetical protein